MPSDDQISLRPRVHWSLSQRLGLGLHGEQRADRRVPRLRELRVQRHQPVREQLLHVLPVCAPAHLASERRYGFGEAGFPRFCEQGRAELHAGAHCRSALARGHVQDAHPVEDKPALGAAARDREQPLKRNKKKYIL